MLNEAALPRVDARHWDDILLDALRAMRHRIGARAKCGKTPSHEGLGCLSLAAYATFLGACSSSGPGNTQSCASATNQPLINGAASERYLGLSQSQVSAIVQIVNSTPITGPLCSGTFVSPNWVVTAQHCLQISSPTVAVQGRVQSPIAVLPIVASVPHPTEDVALLNVDVSVADAGVADGGLLVVEPIQTGSARDSALAAGDVAELAGYGLTETRIVRKLRFLSESIVSVDNAMITVSGFGLSGACAGDSGGPLLIRGPDGSPKVAGVLTSGSANCIGDDVYIRLDGIQSWIQAVVGPSPLPPRDCGTITQEGRCLYGSAIWCTGTTLMAQACSGGQKCGWDAGLAAFRCVDPSVSPCGDVDSVGACEAGVALRCNAGVLERDTCTPCGACRVDGATGSPACVAAPAGR
jgi:V8-like Glu-specific endopeptidase